MLSRVFGGSTPTKKTPEQSGIAPSPPGIDNGRNLVVSPSPVTPAASATPAKAIRLVYTDEKGRFRMDAEAVAALQLVKGPIGVVSVCGRARQGKSFILNQLLGRSSGFQVGPTHRPCTKGLWMWSAPLKRTAPDGTEYNLLLLDSEGIDAYDQTGTYSTQIFSLAVLLSSMFVYNQMGGIDEAALDRLSLVTEMTKHIRVRASQNRTTADELGQFSPVFLWLLRDFYLDLNEGGRKITPREYLESALQPMPGSGKPVYAKNEIRESIRALFPDRHCFTLVRPVNSENDLQRLDLIPMEKMRPEFRAGLDNLTKFIFERARPKQVGSTVLTGPMLAGLTQSFLDAINAGAVPTIATSWQNVEENECRRAYDVGLEVYMTTFDKSTPADESALQEAYDAALQRALAAYSSEAVGFGAIRMKYENQLKAALRRQFEDFKQRAAMESELKCVKAIDSMEERLRAACSSPQATFDQILHLLGELILQYERTISGPSKWRKLVKFLQQSLEGPFNDLLKRTITQASSQASNLELKCRSLEDRLSLTGRQTEAAQREAMDWKKRYEAAIADYKSATELSSGQYAAVQSKLSKLEEKRASLAQQLETAMKEAYEWQSRFEHLQTEHRTDDERYKAEFAALQSRCSAAEARLAAAREQSEAAKEEAAEWRRKHETVLAEARLTAERYNALRERGNKHSQQREDALRAEFNSTISQKDTILAEAHSKLEQSEHIVTDLKARLQGQEAKLQTREEELASLRSEIRSLATSLESAKDSAKIHQNEAQLANNEKLYTEDKLKNAVKKLEEAQIAAEQQSKEARRAIEDADRARSRLTALEKEKLEAMSLAMERLAAVEKAERHEEALKREKETLARELAAARNAQQLLSTKVESLENRLEEREHETETVLLNAHEQRANTVQVLEGLLASERVAHAEANSRAESLSVQLQNVQAKLDALQQELATSRLNETALETKLRTQAESTGRRKQLEESTGNEMEVTPLTESRGGRRKRPRLDFDNGSSQGDFLEEHGSTEVRDSQTQQDYHKFTVSKLKQELTKAGFGAQILQMKNAPKRDFVTLYEECVLNNR